MLGAYNGGLVDASPNRVQCVNGSGVSPAIGPHGHALDYNGSSGTSIANSNGLLAFPTISVFADCYFPSSINYNSSIVSKYDGLNNGSNGLAWLLRVSGSGNLAVYVGDSSSSYQGFETSFYPSVGVWHRLGFTFDGTTCLAYADGTQVFSGSGSGTIPTTIQPTVYVGNTAVAGTPWQGNIDNVHVYAYVLTPSQIEADRADPLQFLAHRDPDLNWANVPQVPVDLSATGSIAFTSSGSLNRTLVLGGTGSIAFTGSASLTPKASFKATGNLEFSGTASLSIARGSCPCNEIVYVASGGVLLGGAATIGGWQITGGVLLGGQATVDVPSDPFYGLEAFWMLQEQGQGLAGEYKDQTLHKENGTGGDGTYAYTPTRTDGVFCRWSQSTNGNQFITLPADNLTNTQPFTIVAWMQYNSRQQAKTIFSRGSSFQFGLSFYGTLQAQVQIENQTYPTLVQGSTRLVKDYWYLVACVVIPDTSLTVYVNGVQDNQVTLPTGQIVAPTTGNQLARWGKGQQLVGNLQDVALFPIALDSAYLTARYNNLCASTFYSIGSETLVSI